MTTNQPGDTNRALRNIIDRSDWRQTLVEDYTATAQRLLEAYQRTLPMLQESANALTQRMSEWNALNPNDPLSSGQVKGLKEFQDLIRRVEVETRDFASLLRNEAAGIQDRAVQIGADGALEMAQKTSGGFGAEIATAWNRVAPEALGALIGYVDGDPFRERTAMFGENAAENISDVILTGVAQGKNPQATARIISTWFNVPYAWADNTLRTVQLYSLRMSNHASYAANSDVLDGWVWSATLDARVCLSCVSQHGSVHKLTETLNDHHRGRCAPVPLVKGTRWLDTMQTGPDWFEGLDDRIQQQQMGLALWSAWKDGAIQWSDMSQKYQDPVYGEMLREASVKGVLGSDAQRYYAYGGL
jgi:hypothetical protein